VNNLGLHEIEKQVKMKSAFQRKRVELMMEELKGMLNTVKELREKVEEFEKEYEDLIMELPEYQRKLDAIKAEVGLPTTEEFVIKKKKPGLLEKITGKGKFYEELSMKILDIATKAAKETGGIISLADLILRVNKIIRDISISPMDVVKALKKLEEAGLISGVRKLKSGVKIVEVYPVELTKDQNEILSLASKKGWITLENVMVETKWSRERAMRALKSLEEAGIAIYDPSYTKGSRWYFPGFVGEKKTK
jgi:predicted transcriptional regulator